MYNDNRQQEYFLPYFLVDLFSIPLFVKTSWMVLLQVIDQIKIVLLSYPSFLQANNKDIYSHCLYLHKFTPTLVKFFSPLSPFLLKVYSFSFEIQANYLDTMILYTAKQSQHRCAKALSQIWASEKTKTSGFKCKSRAYRAEECLLLTSYQPSKRICSQLNYT